MNVLDLVSDLNLVVLMRFGSHLYGTDTPNSDTDYKGVFLPSEEMLLLGKVPKSIRRDSNKSDTKNTSEDVDIELYSLHYFIELACKGETAALDMLHVNTLNLIQGSRVWDNITSNRIKFLTRNLRSFVGYARRQAAKYRVKGSRLNAAKEFIETIDSIGGDPLNRLDSIKSQLSTGDHSRFIEDCPNGFTQYQICGKILQGRITLALAREIMSGFLSAYGERAKLAAKNEGVDWKAISHALRAAYQTKELLTKGRIEYPLEQANFLRRVKGGSLDLLCDVLPELEARMEEVERLSLASKLPDTVDREFWDRFLIGTLRRCLK